MRTSSSEPVVVDANILFSALLRQDSKFTQLLLTSKHPFFVCEATIVELFKHKERIIALSKLSETEVVQLFYLLLRHLTVAKEQLIPPIVRRQAYALCADIDEADTPHVALTLHLGGLLWTGDRRLKTGLEQKGFHAFFTPL